MNIPQPMTWETNPRGDDQQEEATPNRQSVASQHSDGDSQQEDGQEDANDNKPCDLSNLEILYSIESYRAIVTPVALTMILSSLAVVYFNDEETLAAGEQASAQAYQVFDLQEGDMTQNFYASLGNTLIIVSVICVMTFVIVLLYKYRCLKLFYGYMVVVTAILLGYFTANMFIVAIKIYGWHVDKLSFAFVMYNYAVVGTLAIFYQKGIPRWVTQGYLITSSVCMAWQLSYFNDWLAWTLLVMLALYDLFAVLSPCGPLKALAKLISKPGAPQLPGLLYEANLPEGVKKPKGRPKNTANIGDDRNHLSRERQEPCSSSNEEKQPEEGDNSSQGNRDKHAGNETSHTLSMAKRREKSMQWRLSQQFPSSLHNSHPTLPPRLWSSQPENHVGECAHTTHNTSEKRRRDDSMNQTHLPEDVDTSNVSQVPLALARLYKLRILDTKGALRKQRFAKSWQLFYTSEEVREGEWTPRQLRSEVTGIFPARGGKIEKAEEQKYGAGVAYVVYNRLGEEIRKFVITREGTVKQVLKRDSPYENPHDDESNSIKLGIGDFVFYSVLVAKAAQFSFTAFATCFFVVLMGMAATLLILAIKGKALPALPISIFMGVVIFLCTRELIQPWIRDLLRQNFYV
jgi:presenilin 1